MKFKQSFRLAIKSILASKLRAALTMLGIIIGVAAVIILVSVISGFSNTLKDNFASMGANLITVRITNRSALRSVSEDDVAKLVTDNPDLYSAYSPTVNLSSATIKNGDTNYTTTGYGTSDAYQTIKSLTLTEGRFLSYLDVSNRLKVCVIGSYVESELFNGANPIGKTIKINGNQFEIIGVLAVTQGNTQGSGDDCVYMPYTTVARMSGVGAISSYAISAANTQVMSSAVAKLQVMLNNALGSSTSYNIMNSSTITDNINKLTSTLTLVLVGIAAISLLVGGIGIMNIMIVSVTERTREIGIRMSVGAKGRDILMQFLIEAATTSATGGVIGILIGVMASYPISKLIGVTAAVSVQSVIISFTVSAGIGMIFGFFPARNASKMNPIDALRYD